MKAYPINTIYYADEMNISGDHFGNIAKLAGEVCITGGGLFYDHPPVTDKYDCNWCHGRTKDDQYGHCSACGGPRDVGRIWRRHEPD